MRLSLLWKLATAARLSLSYSATLYASYIIVKITYTRLFKAKRIFTICHADNRRRNTIIIVIVTHVRERESTVKAIYTSIHNLCS